MGRIQTGNFGNVVAQPGPRDQVDPDAYGAGIGRALAQAGNTGMVESQNAINRQEAEARQLAREQAAEAKAAAREAARVKALTVTAQVSNGLNDLQDEIDAGLRDNSIPKDKARDLFSDRAQKLKSTALEGVDEEHRPLVDAQLLDNVGRGRQSIGKLVQARDRADILSGGLTYFEEMQRFAARGPKEADQAISNIRTFWSATGPMAGEDPATASKRVQGFVENVRSRQATDLVNADPKAAIKALKNPDYLRELDPDKRSALIQSADTAVLRGEQRAEIRAAAYERKMGQEWKAASTVLEAGKSFEPAYAAELAKRFKGTAYEGALKAMMADGPQNAAFASKPLPTQAAELMAVQAKLNTQGATPDNIATYERMDKAHKAAISDIKADPYKAAAERGVLTELSPLTLDLQQLPGQLAKRGEDARVVSQWAGAPVSLFRPAEAEKVAGILQALPPQDRAGALSGLAKSMTAGQMRAFAVQLGAKDDTLAAAAMLSAQGARTSAGRLVSEIVLAGADAQKEQRLKFPPGQSQAAIRAEIDLATRGAFLGENAQRAAGDAAMAIYAGLLSEGVTPKVQTVVDLATGGVMEFNGQKIIKPRGWSDDQVETAVRKYDAPRVTALTGGQPLNVGGQPVTPDELARHLRNAQLGPSPKPGAYTVSVGGRLVSTADGQPLYLPIGGVPQ